MTSAVRNGASASVADDNTFVTDVVQAVPVPTALETTSEAVAENAYFSNMALPIKSWATGGVANARIGATEYTDPQVRVVKQASLG